MDPEILMFSCLNPLKQRHLEVISVEAMPRSMEAMPRQDHSWDCGDGYRLL